jgi:hypothetical protein
MANLIGGIAPFLGLHNRITGTGQTDAILGDPFTTGNTLGVPEIGAPYRPWTRRATTRSMA